MLQIAEDPWFWIFGKRRRLLRKELKPLVCVDEGGMYAHEQYLQTQHELQRSSWVRPSRSLLAVEQTVTGFQGKDKVFVWTSERASNPDL